MKRTEITMTEAYTVLKTVPSDCMTGSEYLAVYHLGNYVDKKEFRPDLQYETY